MTSYTITYNEQTNVQTGGHKSWFWRFLGFGDDSSSESPEPVNKPVKSEKSRSSSPKRDERNSPRFEQKEERLLRHVNDLRKMSKEEIAKKKEIARKKFVTKNMNNLKDLYTFNFESPTNGPWKVNKDQLIYKKRDSKTKYSRKVDVSVGKDDLINLIIKVHNNIKSQGRESEKIEANEILNSFRDKYNIAIKNLLRPNIQNHNLDKYLVVLIRLITYAAHHDRDLTRNLNILNRYVRENDRIKAISLLVKILLTDVTEQEKKEVLSKLELSTVLVGGSFFKIEK